MINYFIKEIEIYQEMLRKERESSLNLLESRKVDLSNPKARAHFTKCLSANIRASERLNDAMTRMLIVIGADALSMADTEYATLPPWFKKPIKIDFVIDDVVSKIDGSKSKGQILAIKNNTAYIKWIAESSWEDFVDIQKDAINE